MTRRKPLARLLGIEEAGYAREDSGGSDGGLLSRIRNLAFDRHFAPDSR
jgi:hypothetical protein